MKAGIVFGDTYLVPPFAAPCRRRPPHLALQPACAGFGAPPPLRGDVGKGRRSELFNPWTEVALGTGDLKDGPEARRGAATPEGVVLDIAGPQGSHQPWIPGRGASPVGMPARREAAPKVPPGAKPTLALPPHMFYLCS